MRILPEETGAVVIDMQEKLMMAMNETKVCEEKAAMLLKGLQVLSIPTVIVQQYTKGLGHTLPSLYEAAGTTEYCEKASFSCCRNKAILDKLESPGSVRTGLLPLLSQEYLPGLLSQWLSSCLLPAVKQLHPPPSPAEILLPSDQYRTEEHRYVLLFPSQEYSSSPYSQAYQESPCFCNS